MAKMALGYGSEFHLLRYFGRHLDRLNQCVSSVVGAKTIRWLDWNFDPTKLDRELKGLDFLHPADSTRKTWLEFWPKTGNPPNWDAVARITFERGGEEEWLLVEAKANVQELTSNCEAKGKGLGLITNALETVKTNLQVPSDRDWLKGYYQYCNRVAVSEFLNRQKTPTHLMFIYFLGDKGGPTRTCPADKEGWRKALEAQRAHVGLEVGSERNHLLSGRVHQLFLEVCPQNEGAASQALRPRSRLDYQ